MLGIPTYAGATLVAIWSPASALVLYGAIALFYLLPGVRLDRLLVPELTGAEPAPDGEAEEVAPSREPQRALFTKHARGRPEAPPGGAR